MTRTVVGLGVLSIVAFLGCASQPEVVPLVVKRSLPLDAKGGLEVGGLTPLASKPDRDEVAGVRGYVRLWNVDRDALEDLVTPGLPSALARILAPDSTARLIATLDAATLPEERGESDLRLAQSGIATVEFTRQRAYLSSWSIQFGESAIAADPNIDVAQFGARISLMSGPRIQESGAPPACPVSLVVEIAEPNGELRKESMTMRPGSPATIEIPLVSRLTLKASEALAADESMLIVAPDLNDLERGIVILLEVDTTPRP